ncbi:hypothetical protein Tco_1146698 [Tanacetum coccineum]
MHSYEELVDKYDGMEKSWVDEYNKCLELDAELVKKKDMVEKDVYNELSKSFSKLEKHCLSLKIAIQQRKEGMLKLDLQPLSPKLMKNKEAHVDYNKQTKEHADLLRAIVEQARALKPLDNALEYACKFATQIQELLVYVSATCPSSRNNSEKLVDVTSMNKNRQVRFEEPSHTSTSNTQKHVETHNNQNTNRSFLPSTGVRSSTNASGSQPRSNTRNKRISRPSSSNMNKKIEA